MNFRFLSLILFFSFFICLSALFAQPSVEPLEKWQFETGYSHYWYKGDFYWTEQNPSYEDVWSTGTFYIRSGLYGLFTLSLEAMAWTVHSSSNYPGESFANFNIGFGLSSPSIKIFIFDIFLYFHYLENLYLDRSEQESDKRFRSAQIGAPLRLQIINNFTIWAAPVYVWDESEYYEDQNFSRSSKSPGISFGLDGLLFNHIYLNLGATYTDYFQPWVTAGYRF